MNQYFSSLLPSANTVWKAFVFVTVLLSLFAVMIWDMKKAQQLSEIIHNDHASRWVQMDSKMLTKWLSPLDLCMMKSDQPVTDLKVYRSKNCSKLTSIGGVQSQKLFCNIGSSLGRQCSSPLSTRSFFTARIKDDVLGDPEARYLSRTLKLIAASHRPVVFIGDGISKQNQDALICEIMRTDKVTISGSMSGEYSQLQSNFTVRWRDTSSMKLDVLYYKMTHYAEIPTAARERRRQRNIVRSLTQSQQPLSTPTATAGNGTRANVSISLGQLNDTSNAKTPVVLRATSLSFEEVKRSVEALVAVHSGVVVIANLGVWYNSREKFRLETPLFLHWLNDLGAQTNKNNLVFFRETAAQHWNQSSTGYYSHEEREINNGSCSPVADSTPDFDWRNNDVHHIIVNENMNKIHSILFRDLTLPLYNMHPSDNEGLTPQDCTHYCYFPQMWQSVWYDLYRTTYNITGHAAVVREKRNIRRNRRKVV